MHKRITLLFLSLASTLGFLNVALGGSASASSCILGSFSNHGTTYLGRSYSAIIYSPGGTRVAGRDNCAVVGVSGDPNGWYQFVVTVQDTWDVASGLANVYNDDTGYSLLQYTTPGTTVWHDSVMDRNSADFAPNESNYGNTWYSPWYHVVLDGPPQNFNWRFLVSTHYKLNNVWQWSYVAGPSFKVSMVGP